MLNTRWIDQLVLVFGLALIAGCAAPTLTREEAATYVGKTLTQFLAERFSDSQSKLVGGNYLYTAFYNEVNNRQLYRPSTELVNFCKAQAGTVRMSDKYTGDPLARAFRSPTLDALSADLQGRAAGASREVIDTAMLRTYLDAQEVNARYELAGARQGYQEAANANIYGTFTCYTDVADSSMKWRVRVEPVGFLRKVAGEGLSSHKLMILISPVAAP